MLLLVSGAMPTLEKFARRGVAGLGHLWTPTAGNCLDRQDETGLPWAVDNGCFNPKTFSVDGYLRYLLSRHWERKSGPLFVTVPDKVGDHDATARRFYCWAAYLLPLDLPLAFVAQNGATPASVPWGLFSCLFIGGAADDDGQEWKTSGQAAALIREAKKRSKWVHVGRVNGRRRFAWCVEQGVDSVDGTGQSIAPETNIPLALSWMGQEAAAALAAG